MPAAGVHVAPDRADVEPRPERMELCGATKAARADDGSVGQPRESRSVPGDEAVPRVVSRADRADRDVERVLGGEVLERVHGEVEPAVPQPLFELRGEEALASDLRQRLLARLRPVPLRDDRTNFAGETRPCRFQQLDDTSGLALGEGRPSGPDDDRLRGRPRPHRRR